MRFLIGEAQLSESTTSRKADVGKLKGANVICIASSSWDDLWVNSQHLMYRLSRENRILYIESTGLRAPARSKADIKKIWRRVKNFWRGGNNWVNDNLLIIPPFTLPLYKYTFIKIMNDLLLQLQIKYLIKKYNFVNPILWIFLPSGEGLIGSLNEKLIVYHCVDDYSSNPGVPKKRIEEMERKILEKADLVFVTSPNLYSAKRKLNSNTFYFPNVADTEFFRRTFDGIEIPEEMTHISKPIIGYIGNISNYKFDIELVCNAAQRRSDWSFVLIGPIGYGDPNTDISLLLEQSNIHLLGKKPYNTLPEYLKSFDVCIIPFRRNSYTESSFPMKFHEYLAAGKKIVTTALPSFENFRNIAYVTDSSEDFLHAIELALTNDISTDQWKLRNRIIEDNSWDRRVDELSSLVFEKLKRH